AAKAISGLMRRSKTVSFDHLVGAREQRCRRFEVQCFRGLEVYHQFELRRQLHGQIGWLGTPQYSINIGCRLSEVARQIDPEGYQSAFRGKEAIGVEGGQTAVRRGSNDRTALCKRYRSGERNETAIRLAGEFGNCCLNLRRVTHR